MNDYKICCFTGHRHIKPEHAVFLPRIIDDLLDSLIKKGCHTFRAGGAMGFDTICALKVLEKKRIYNDTDIKLELFLPCRDQSNGWSEGERNIYKFILANADSIDYSQDRYIPGCMHERNRRLVDGADVCIAYLISSKGGTAYTCSYAKKNQVDIINVKDLIPKKD